jgi:hypothetical protein
LYRSRATDYIFPAKSGLAPILAAVLEGAPKELILLMRSYGADIKSLRFQRKSAKEVAEERGFSHLGDVLDPEQPVAAKEFQKVAFTFDFCAMCRKQGLEFTPCGMCGLVAYCGEDCRAKHWKVGGHKDVCQEVLARQDEDEDEE